MKLKENTALKSLYREEDKDFLEKCVKLSFSSMRHLNHWNYKRTLFFDMVPKNLKIAEGPAL